MSETYTQSLNTPTELGERISILDSLRGIAVLGILLMNIPFFGLPEPVFENPAVLNEQGTINEWVHLAVHVLFDGTQRALFSLLFGAGILLFIERIEKKNSGLVPADLFVKRQLWLIVFGLFNAYVLLWAGDILFTYGVCGIILFAFRRLSPRKLIVAAGICLAICTVRENVDLYRVKNKIDRGIELTKTDPKKLTEEQKEDLEAMKKIKEKSTPKAWKAVMDRTLKTLRGSYADAYNYMKDVNLKVEISFTYNHIWDILIFMFLGMAFFKSGLLLGRAPVSVYLVLTVLGLGLGWWIGWDYTGALRNVGYNNFKWLSIKTMDYYEFVRTLRSLGIFGLIMVLYKSGVFGWLFRLMQPVGQMAFTNYLSQSLICNVLFLGFGFGWIGHLQRYELYYVVLSIWVAQIIWSHFWLRYFRFGPLEWCWRSLTYWKIQEFRK